MPPRTRILRSDPNLEIMPNFYSNGYAPSRARKRRMLHCTNEEAIQLLQDEWQQRHALNLDLWQQQQQQQQQQQPLQQRDNSQPNSAIEVPLGLEVPGLEVLPPVEMPAILVQEMVAMLQNHEDAPPVNPVLTQQPQNSAPAVASNLSSPHDNSGHE